MLDNYDDLLFQILTVDRFFHKKGTFHVAARPYAALSFRETGVGTFKIGNKILHTKPGDVLFIPSGVPYEVEYSTSESIVVNMAYCNYSEAEVFELQPKSDVSILFSRLLAEWQEHHSFHRAKATIFTILERIREYNKTKNENTALAECVQYIELHFCDAALDIKSICNAGFLSRSGLYRLFVNYFSMSPKEYITKLRMNKAVTLLVESGLSIKEIASICGFFDDKYFSRVFKSTYGYSPSQLRKHSHM